MYDGLEGGAKTEPWLLGSLEMGLRFGVPLLLACLGLELDLWRVYGVACDG